MRCATAWNHASYPTWAVPGLRAAQPCWARAEERSLERQSQMFSLLVQASLRPGGGKAKLPLAFMAVQGRLAVMWEEV